eukprot:9735856-Lingulodinium_polyedra.AAC.1
MPPAAFVDCNIEATMATKIVGGAAAAQGVRGRLRGTARGCASGAARGLRAGCSSGAERRPAQAR